MTLLQISEPNQSLDVNSKIHKIALGIDLGTTNSLVAWVKNTENHTIEVLADENGDTLLPSVVYFDELKTLVGHSAQAYSLDYPQETIMSVKRLMGKHAYDLTENSLDRTSYQIINQREKALPLIKTKQGGKKSC